MGIHLPAEDEQAFVRLWDVTTGEIRLTLTDERARATSIALSPDGKTVATGGADALYLWDTITGEHRATLAESSGWGYGTAFSSDGSTVAARNQNDTVRLWDARTGAHKLSIPGHTEPLPAGYVMGLWLCIQPG